MNQFTVIVLVSWCCACKRTNFNCFGFFYHWFMYDWKAMTNYYSLPGSMRMVFNVQAATVL